MSGRRATAIPRLILKVLVSEKIGIKAEYSSKVYSIVVIEKPKTKSYLNVKKDRKVLPKRVAISHP
jgi:hypothetical protein